MNNNFPERYKFLYSLCSITLTTILLFIVRNYYLFSGHDLATDVYYHIRISDMFPNFIFMKTFPWAELSIWKTHFYDKELTFHLLVHCIRYIQQLLNISLQPPFNLINGLFIFSIFFVYSFGCYFSKLKYSYLVPLLFVVLNPLFLYRLFMIRPHLLSIILFGISIFLLLSKLKNKIKTLFLFIMGFLYSYSYSSPHILLLPVFSYCAALLLLNENKKFKITLFFISSSIFGIITGFIIHPQFPNTFYVWFVQTVIVLKSILVYTENIRVGQELYGINYYVGFTSFLIYLFTLLNLYLFAKNKNRNIETITLLIISIISLLGFSFSMRFIEYIVPANTLLFIYLLNSVKKPINFDCRRTNKYQILTIIFISLFIINLKIINIKNGISSPYYSFAEWAEKHIKPDSYIAQVNWDTFPFLFYVSPQYRYSSVLDPMFTYAAYPEKAINIHKFRTLQILFTPEELKKLFGTNLLFISKKDYPVALYLNKISVFYLYQGKDGWLFDLNKFPE